MRGGGAAPDARFVPLALPRCRAFHGDDAAAASGTSTLTFLDTYPGPAAPSKPLQPVQVEITAGPKQHQAAVGGGASDTDTAATTRTTQKRATVQLSPHEAWWRENRIGTGSDDEVRRQFQKICAEICHAQTWQGKGQINDWLTLCKSSADMRVLIEEMNQAIKWRRRETHGSKQWKPVALPDINAHGKIIRRLVLENDLVGAALMFKKLETGHRRRRAHLIKNAKKYDDFVLKDTRDDQELRILKGGLKSTTNRNKLNMRRLNHLNRMEAQYQARSDPAIRAHAWHFVEAMRANSLRHQAFYECMVRFCDTSEQVSDVIWEMKDGKGSQTHEFEHQLQVVGKARNSPPPLSLPRRRHRRPKWLRQGAASR